MGFTARVGSNPTFGTTELASRRSTQKTTSPLRGGSSRSCTWAPVAAPRAFEGQRPSAGVAPKPNSDFSLGGRARRDEAYGCVHSPSGDDGTMQVFPW